MDQQSPETFERKLASLLNSESMEVGSDTPDFILADFLSSCLKAFDKATNSRISWFKSLSGSEALYGFAAWLTTRKEAITIGSNHDAAAVCDLVKRFCDENHLDEPRDNKSSHDAARERKKRCILY
jgi:hypothetical protein